MSYTQSDYAIRATRYRPSDPIALAREIRRLRTEQHLQPRDISNALAINIATVLDALAGNSPINNTARRGTGSTNA